MIITYIYSTDPGDALRVQLRCRNIADAINRVGWHSAHLLSLDDFVHTTAEADKICAASDLLVIHRYLYGPVLQAVAYWKARDKKVIVDFDQAISYLTPDIPGHAFWMEGSPLGASAAPPVHPGTRIDSTPLEQFKWGLGLIDAAVVSSMRLVVDWAPFVHVYEIPDYLNTDQYPASKQEYENVTIGLAHGARLSSLRKSGLLEALQSIFAKRADVQLVWNNLGEEDAGGLGIPTSHLVVRRSCSFDDWAKTLLTLDVGLIPIYGDYDLRLSRINLLEFMISKTPWIASNQPSFREFSRFGKLVPNSPGIWESTILKAIDNREALRKKAAGEPFLFALSQDVNQNIDKVLKLFTYILNQTN